jgi:hypothetical protein
MKGAFEAAARPTPQHVEMMMLDARRPLRAILIAPRRVAADRESAAR